MNNRYLFFGFVIVVLALSVLLAGCGKPIDGKKKEKGLSLPDKPQSSEQPPALPAEGAEGGAPPAPPSGGSSGQKASGLPLLG